MWNVGVNPTFFLQRMFETFEDVPINVCFLARGCSSRPQGLMQSIEAGAGGLKIHEDLGAFPSVVDCCLSVAEQMDVGVAMHMDGLNESAELSDTLAAIAGRAVHAYHAEGAGGGPYDLLEIVAQPNVMPSSTNPTIPFTTHTAAEHFDMIMTVHGLNPAFPEDVLAARHRVRPETMAAETPLHDLGAISITASDSLGMGRIGETIRRTWQMAHAMQVQENTASMVDDGMRIRVCCATLPNTRSIRRLRMAYRSMLAHWSRGNWPISFCGNHPSLA